MTISKGKNELSSSVLVFKNILLSLLHLMYTTCWQVLRIKAILMVVFAANKCAFQHQCVLCFLVLVSIKFSQSVKYTFLTMPGSPWNYSCHIFWNMWGCDICLFCFFLSCCCTCVHMCIINNLGGLAALLWHAQRPSSPWGQSGWQRCAQFPLNLSDRSHGDS